MTGFCYAYRAGKALLLSLAAFAPLSPTVAGGTLVTVHVLNVSSARGVVRVAICREEEWPIRACAYGGHTIATPGLVDVVVDVPPGSYGVLAHHDANSDGQVNKNLLGVPVEGVGFSRDPHIRFGFPSFSSVSLPIAGDNIFVNVFLLFEAPGVSVHERQFP